MKKKNKVSKLFNKLKAKNYFLFSVKKYKNRKSLRPVLHIFNLYIVT